MATKNVSKFKKEQKSAEKKVSPFQSCIENKTKKETVFV